jgi:hypothetical protein
MFKILCEGVDFIKRKAKIAEAWLRRTGEWTSKFD